MNIELRLKTIPKTKAQNENTTAIITYRWFIWARLYRKTYVWRIQSKKNSIKWNKTEFFFRSRRKAFEKNAKNLHQKTGKHDENKFIKMYDVRAWFGIFFWAIQLVTFFAINFRQNWIIVAFARPSFHFTTATHTQFATLFLLSFRF